MVAPRPLAALSGRHPAPARAAHRTRNRRPRRPRSYRPPSHQNRRRLLLHPRRQDAMRPARVEEDQRRSRLQLRPWPALLIGALLRPWALEADRQSTRPLMPGEPFLLCLDESGVVKPSSRRCRCCWRADQSLSRRKYHPWAPPKGPPAISLTTNQLR